MTDLPRLFRSNPPGDTKRYDPLARSRELRKAAIANGSRAREREHLGGPAVATHARNYATCVTCAASQRRDSLSRTASVYSKEMAGMSDLSEMYLSDKTPRGNIKTKDRELLGYLQVLLQIKLINFWNKYIGRENCVLFEENNINWKDKYCINKYMHCIVFRKIQFAP